MEALRWWKFEPYRVNGEPVAVETTVAVEFKR
jgi:outer membrane biosynthesis protein TonB